MRTVTKPIAHSMALILWLVCATGLVAQQHPTVDWKVSIAELETRLDPARTMPDQKKALAELLTQLRIGDYDSRLGARIAEAMD